MQTPLLQFVLYPPEQARGVVAVTQPSTAAAVVPPSLPDTVVPAGVVVWVSLQHLTELGWLGQKP